MRQHKFIDLFANDYKEKEKHSPTFMELIDCNDEFAFFYHGTPYELINGNEDGKGMGCSLYLADGNQGKFLQSFSSRKDFLDYAKIDGKNIVEILRDIQI